MWFSAGTRAGGSSGWCSSGELHHAFHDGPEMLSTWGGGGGGGGGGEQPWFFFVKKPSSAECCIAGCM